MGWNFEQKLLIEKKIVELMKAPKCFVELMMCNRKKSLHFLYPQRKLQISLEMNREKSWKMNNRNENSLNMFRCQGVRTTVFSRHSQSAHSTSNMNSLFIHLFNDLLSQFLLIWYIIGYAICRIVTVSACERKVKNITSTTTHTQMSLWFKIKRDKFSNIEFNSWFFLAPYRFGY